MKHAVLIMAIQYFSTIFLLTEWEVSAYHLLTEFAFRTKHLLVFLAPNIIFIGQLEKDIGRRASGVQYLSPADQ